MTARYLVCRPLGGWNDTLCQVSVCYSYAKKYNRILVLDMEKYSGIKDKLCNYFEFILNEVTVVYQIPTGINAENSTLTLYPEFIDSVSGYVMEGRFLKGTKTQVTFDFNKDYHHDILIHHTDGGGGESFKLLKILRLREDIVNSSKLIIKNLNNKYHSTMIRNTDYKTDFITHFEKIKEDVGSSKLFLATDDGGCLDYAKNLFGDQFNSISKPPKLNNSTALIYNNFGPEVQKFYNVNSLIELVVCASADIFHVSYINAYKDLPLRSGSMSGFILLAKTLNDNKDVLANMMTS